MPSEVQLVDGVWDSQVDPSSGATYFFHVITGETMWEEDFLRRRRVAHDKGDGDGKGASKSDLKASNSSSGTFSSVADRGDGVVSAQKSAGKGGSETADVIQGDDSGVRSEEKESVMLTTARIRLRTFLETHDQDRLEELALIMSQYAGRERQMLTDLCKRYNVSPEGELRAFGVTYRQVRRERGGAGGAGEAKEE